MGQVFKTVVTGTVPRLIWEYRVERMHPDDDWGLAKMNELGAEGWECIEIHTGPPFTDRHGQPTRDTPISRLTFKRQRWVEG